MQINLGNNSIFGPDVLQLTADVIISPLDPCILLCRKGRVGTPRGRVKDGTRSNINPMIKDVCIEGISRVKIKIIILSKHSSVQTRRGTANEGEGGKHEAYRKKVKNGRKAASRGRQEVGRKMQEAWDGGQ